MYKSYQNHHTLSNTHTRQQSELISAWNLAWSYPVTC